MAYPFFNHRIRSVVCILKSGMKIMAGPECCDRLTRIKKKLDFTIWLPFLENENVEEKALVLRGSGVGCTGHTKKLCQLTTKDVKEEYENKGFGARRIATKKKIKIRQC